MTKALICKQAGQWQQVLSLQEKVLPPNPPAGCVRVRMLASAVHPSDFGMIAGSYGKAKVFPCVMGREGVGRIVMCEGSVSGVKIGDMVRLPEELGAWQSEVDCPADKIFVCPKDLSPQQLALSFINPPTALRILEDFVALQPGDVIITNAGKSAVSQAFIQLGCARGLRVHSVVRDKTPADEIWLKSLGAEAVWDESREYFKEVKAALALNQVGGESVLKLIKSLCDHGVCVTIGGAAKEPVRYPTRELIFKDAHLRGFWMDRWMREHPDGVSELMGKIWDLMRSGKLTQEVAGEFDLADYAAALALAEDGRRRGKVLLRG